MGEQAKLTDLAARFTDGPVSGVQRLRFLCPLCRKAEIMIHVWGADAANLKVGEETIHVWHAEQDQNRGWETFTVKPSVDAKHGYDDPERCVGWHGFITNGVCQ